MRPNLSLLCILLLINYALLELSEEAEKQIDSCDDGSFTPSKESDCTNVLGSEAKDAGYRCCFIEYQFKSKPENMSQEGNECLIFNQTQYKNMNDRIEEVKDEAKQKGNEFTKLKVKCQSSYLKIGLIGLIFALIL